jgi:hypothetical protein
MTCVKDVPKIGHIIDLWCLQVYPGANTVYVVQQCTSCNAVLADWTIPLGSSLEVGGERLRTYYFNHGK